MMLGMLLAKDFLAGIRGYFDVNTTGDRTIVADGVSQKLTLT